MPQSSSYFTPTQLKPVLDYIESHWLQLERYQPHDEGTLIGLPHPYIVPSLGQSHFDFQEMYYWDSYFIAQGLYGTKWEKLASGMLENLLYLARRFGSIPTASRYYLLGRSQPPLLTSFILEVYELHPNEKWLSEAMDVAKLEYRNVWLGDKHPHWRRVFKGLSRYYNIEATDESAETECGMDMNPRFDNQCLSYLPVDLNALLYKYEKDFETAATILGDHVEAKTWGNRAYRRRQTMDRYMWDESAGFYFDYNFHTGKRSPVWSLAGYYPLWAGMVSPNRAERMVANLTKFEHAGGLATTARAIPDPKPRQWEYPNGWAPLHWLVIQGLIRYHHRDVADRIARNWLQTNLTQFGKTGYLLEKYNVVEIQKPAKDGWYPSQRGFGWTNAIFYRLCHDLLLPQELPAEAEAKLPDFILPRWQLGWKSLLSHE